MKTLYVNEPGFDDVGEVLRALDLPFAPLDGRSFDDPTNSVVFLNCGSEFEGDPRFLRSFIDNGGTVYASDLQADLLAAAAKGERGVAAQGVAHGRVVLPERGLHVGVAVEELAAGGIGEGFEDRVHVRSQ